MPVCRMYRTRCRHCRWRGYVTFGDLRMGPWLREDGTAFNMELICPKCGEQVEDPRPEPERPTTPITREQEEAYRRMKKDTSEPSDRSSWIRKAAARLPFVTLLIPLLIWLTRRK